MKRIFWLDGVKAMCMLFVYLQHAQVYTAWEGFDSMLLGRPFYINAFFFVSGYLFFGKWLFGACPPSLNVKDYMKALRDMAFRQFIPMILFSSLIYLPKQLFHGNGLSIGKYVFDVFGGVSYWFLAAFIVTQLVLLTAIFMVRKRSIWMYVPVSVACFALGHWLGGMRSGCAPENYFPMYYQTGLEYTVIMVLGGIYRRYEAGTERVLKRLLWLVGIVYASILAWSLYEGIALKLFGIGRNDNVDAVGLVCVLCGICLITALCKWMRPVQWLSYIGRNSILFYFFSGVWPAAFSVLARRFLPDMGYFQVLIVAVVSVLAGIATTYLVNRYAPFLTDLRKLKRSEPEYS